VSPGPTFDRIYRALKGSLLRAEFGPGEHLEPVALGDRLHASATPVRDALQRLVGERLVEAPRHEGFRVPTLTEPELRDLLDWRARLLELALRRPAPPASDGAKPRNPVIATGPASTADLFLAIAGSTDSDAHLAAFAQIGDRLAAIEVVEPAVFDDLDAEFAELQLSFASRHLTELRRGIAAYHRRRQRAAAELLAALRSRSQRQR